MIDIFDAAVAAAIAKGSGGGSGGTTDYDDLSSKPEINGNQLVGDKSSSDLGLQPLIDSTHKLSADLVDDTSSTNKLAHIDNEGGLWIGSAQYIKIMDSASYAALATKEDIIYMVYPTPTPAPSLSMGGAKSEISEGNDEKTDEPEEKELKEPIVEEKEDFQEKWGLSDNDMDEPMAMRSGGWD